MKKGSLRTTSGGLILAVVVAINATPAPATAQIPQLTQPLQLLQSVSPDVLEAGCTSIMVARLASADGSVITCHSCDGNYRTWVTIEPHRTFDQGTLKSIYWGLLHTETPDDMRRVRLKGQIPEAPETYAFMNVGYPCMNEKGLAIGETTIGSRGGMRNDEGLFLIENLQQIVLERCTTAREAIKLIGELVKEYGYGDNGECLTFADANEVWHFEIMGAGPFEVGAVWAAVRIPDDHVGVSANIPRISEINLDDPDRYMASDNVFSLAEEMGWWDSSSGEPFKFWKAYSRQNRQGEPSRPYSTREFYILSTMAPDLGLTMDMEELPFSVKPNRKVSVQEVMKYYRETYEGTEFDMTKNLPRRTRRYRDPVTREWREGEPEVSPLVNNWSLTRDWATLLNSIKEGTVQTQRTIAVDRCSYSQVIQCRGWLPPEVGTIAWFSFDNPGQSPRIPIFAGTLELPESFAICGQHKFRTDSACWWFRRANRLAMIKWGQTREFIEGGVMKFEEKAFAELPLIEQRALELSRTDQLKYREFLTEYTNSFARAAMQEWWEMGDMFWGMFARGW